MLLSGSFGAIASGGRLVMGVNPLAFGPVGHGMLAMVVTVLMMAAATVSSAGDTSREALPGIIGQDDRRLLDTTEWPWVAIGRINRESGGFCTGTLVRSDVVVTAAHCLLNTRTQRRIAPTRLHFLAGYNRGNFQAHARGRAFVTAVRTPAGLSESVARLANDWVLLRLDRRLEIRPIPVETITGKETLLQRSGLSRAGYEQDRAHILSLHRRCSLLGQAAGGLLMVHDCDLTRGGSGSPLLRISDGSVSVVGIAIASTVDEAREHGLGVPADTFIDVLTP